jgi:HAD superfamily hydrolase (TIGR01450 family)
MTALCLDLDGVIWRGDEPIAGSADAVAKLRTAGLEIVFVTNNSSMTAAEYGAKLTHVGVPSDGTDVLSSAMSAARLLAGDLPAGARVLTFAGPGVVESLEQHGLQPVRELPAAAVVVGWHRDFGFASLTVAADAVRGGARFVATNTDPTYPVAGGVVPGCGALVAAVATAGGREPDIVAGKPYAPMALLVRERTGPNGVMVGDRLSTDGAFAAALGWPFALVLSGVAGSDPTERSAAVQPAHVADDLAALVPVLAAAYTSPMPR